MQEKLHLRKYFLFCLFGGGFAIFLLASAVRAEDVIPAKLIDAQIPDYPRDALIAKQEGDVVVGFDVNELGLVENPYILLSSPPGIFDAAAINAVAYQSRFLPALSAGKLRRTIDKKIMVSFRLSDAWLPPALKHKSFPIYPLGALAKKISGFCWMQITIGPDGNVAQADLLGTAPRDVFSSSCLNGAKKFEYIPPGDEKAGRVRTKFKTMVTFNIKDGMPKRKIAGIDKGDWVKIEYSVSKEGQLRDTKVVAKSNEDILTDSALRQIAQIQVQPFTENGVAVEKTHLLLTIAAEPEAFSEPKY